MVVLSSLVLALDTTQSVFENEFPERLLAWNENLESLLVNPNAASQSSPVEEAIDNIKCRLHECACSIQNAIVSSLLRIEPQDDFAGGGTTKAEAALQRVKAKVNERDFLDLNSVVALSILLRTTKNLLRWYIQVLRSSRHGSAIALDNPTEALQNLTMIELYVVFIETNSGNFFDSERQELARNSNLALFYATYGRHPNDRMLQKIQTFLVESFHFPRVAIKALAQNNTTPLVLSVMRNVHNLLVSVPQASKSFEELTVELSPKTDQAPWVANDAECIDFMTLTENILWWLIKESNPPFPAKNEDRVYELALEILRTWYAMRAGRRLESPNVDTLLSRLVLEIFRLPESDDRCFQCQLAMVCLLTDSNQAFGEYLSSHHVLPFLLHALECQASYVVDKTVTGDSAASAIVPILAVINKYSIGNPLIKQLVKDSIFPKDSEASFQQKAAEEIERTAGAGIGAKNMSPLDAPKGTLRWKLIKLLTWTESNTKRVAGEMLWTLCDNDPRQFALRTGLGNALPLLAAKGFAKLPI